MAKIFGKNRSEDFKPDNLMSFGKSFSRMGGQPLDESEVWYDLTALQEFAASDAAYVGMKVVYVDEGVAEGDNARPGKVYQYAIQLDGSLKEIGVAPRGDNGVSIDVSEADGVVSLHGVAEAADGYLPRVKVSYDTDGKETGRELEWDPISAIINDTNDVTVVQIADDSTSILTLDKKDVGETHTYTLGVNLPAAPEYAISSTADSSAKTTTYTLTKDGNAVAKSIVVPNAYDDTALAQRINAIDGDNGRLAVVEEKVNTFLDVTEASDEVVDTLSEIIAVINGDENSAVAGLLADVAENKRNLGSLLEGDNSVASQIAAAEARVEAKGYATTGAVDQLDNKYKGLLEGDNSVASQIAAAEARVEAKGYATTADITAAGYATKAEIAAAGYATTAEVAAAGYATKAEITAADYATNSELDKVRQTATNAITQSKLEETLADYYTKAETYTQTEIDELIAELVGVDYDPDLTVSAINGKLEKYIEDNDKAILDLNGEIDKVADRIISTVATIDNLGLVKSVANDVENGVAVGADGKMSVNSVNVNKLVQTAGETLVLNGGSAEVAETSEPEA